MSFYSSVLRRRLLTIAKLGADFSIVYNGVEYKPGDTITITASTTVTVTGKGTAKVTLVGGGGGGADFAGDSDNPEYFSGGDGGDGGMSVFTAELESGTYTVTVGEGGRCNPMSNGSPGGTTSAFGHSASGGGGATPASDWGNGYNGSMGVGETSDGNNTAYGRGGSGNYYTGGADSGSSGVCIIELVDPDAKEYVVTLSGTFDATNSYVTIAGEKITSPGEYSIPVGDPIVLYIKKPNAYGSGGGIVINGTKVVSASTTLQSYDYFVESNCTVTGTTSGTSYSKAYTLTLVSE